MPSNIIQDIDSGLPTAVVTWTEPTATDNSGSQLLQVSHTPGSTFSIGVTSVEYRAVDIAGNEAVANFTVTIEGMAFTVCHSKYFVLICMFLKKRTSYSWIRRAFLP